MRSRDVQRAELRQWAEPELGSERGELAELAEPELRSHVELVRLVPAATGLHWRRVEQVQLKQVKPELCSRRVERVQPGQQSERELG